MVKLYRFGLAGLLMLVLSGCTAMAYGTEVDPEMFYVQPIEIERPPLPVAPQPQMVPPGFEQTSTVDTVKVDISVYSPIGEGDCMLLGQGFPIILDVETAPQPLLFGFTLVTQGSELGSLVFLDESTGEEFTLLPGETHYGPFTVQMNDSNGGIFFYEGESFPFFTYLGRSAENSSKFCVTLPAELQRAPEPQANL